MRGRHLAAAPKGVEPAGNVFCTAIVVGHVEGVEACLGIDRQLSRQSVEIEFPPILLHVGDLPEAGDQTADLEAGSKQDPGGLLLHGEVLAKRRLRPGAAASPLRKLRWISCRSSP